MRTSVPEKLLAIVDDIEGKGSVPLTRLTVLKKWFERPGRLPAFGAWVGRRAAAKKGKTRGEAGALYNAARALLAKADAVCPAIDLAVATALRDRLYAFQCEYDKQRWANVRIIRQWNLLLVEKGLNLILRAATPTEGYKLSADYCQNYDPRHGNGLNGPSRGRILEIVRFMFTIEALEDERPSPTSRSTGLSKPSGPIRLSKGGNSSGRKRSPKAC